MILYNTLMGVAAGLALILIPLLGRKIVRRQHIAAEGWSVTLGVLGTILTGLGGLMATTWPLTANPPINILFAEPCLFLGLLLLGAAWYLWKKREVLASIGGAKTASEVAFADIQRTLWPVSWLVFGLGLILAACTLAILRFGFIGGAPPQEPITGLLSNHPAIENTFFGIIYGLSAIGALLAPWARSFGSKAAKVAAIVWIIAGCCFLLFSAMNYYTHIGLLVNLSGGDRFEF